jgi:ankyrin repeat protein
LQLAVNNNHPDAVEALLKYHWRPSEILVSFLARSAAAAGFAGVFKLLAPLEDNVGPYSYNPAMMNAIYTRNVDMVEALVRNKRGVSSSGMGAAAMVAALENRTPLLELVLAEYPETAGSALQVASNVGRTEMVAFLLRHSTAVLNSRDLRASLEFAIDSDHLETLKTLLGNNCMTPVLTSDAMGHAAKQGKLDALECLVDHPIEPLHNALPMALLLAASSGHVDCTAYVMRQFPAHKLEAVNRNAIRFAIHGKHKAVVTFLLDQGAVVPPELQSQARNLVALDDRIDLLRDLVGGKRSLPPPLDAENGFKRLRA